MSIQERWQEIVGWMQEHIPEVTETLREGARAVDFAALEQRYGTLPLELYTLYGLNDGQEDRAVVGPILGLPFLPLYRVVEEIESFAILLEEEPDYGTELEGESFPTGHVHLTYINLKRIPIADYGGGNFVGIDLDPDALGTCGQIINFGRDERNKYVLAKSLTEFLDFLDIALQAGKFEVVDFVSPFSTQALSWENTESKSLFNDWSEIFCR